MHTDYHDPASRKQARNPLPARRARRRRPGPGADAGGEKFSKGRRLARLAGRHASQEAQHRTAPHRAPHRTDTATDTTTDSQYEQEDQHQARAKKGEKKTRRRAFSETGSHPLDTIDRPPHPRTRTHPAMSNTPVTNPVNWLDSLLGHSSPAVQSPTQSGFEAAAPEGYTTQQVLDVYNRMTQTGRLQIDPNAAAANSARASSLHTPLSVELLNGSSAKAAAAPGPAAPSAAASAAALHLHHHQPHQLDSPQSTSATLGNPSSALNSSQATPKQSFVSTNPLLSNMAAGINRLGSSTPEISHIDHDMAKFVQPAAVQWFYQDLAGTQQGPFDSLTMQQWYSTGLLVSTLPVRRDGEANWLTISDLWKKCKSLPNFDPDLAPFNQPLPVSLIHQPSLLTPSGLHNNSMLPPNPLTSFNSASSIFGSANNSQFFNPLSSLSNNNWPQSPLNETSPKPIDPTVNTNEGSKEPAKDNDHQATLDSRSNSNFNSFGVPNMSPMNMNPMNMNQLGMNLNSLNLNMGGMGGMGMGLSPMDINSMNPMGLNPMDMNAMNNMYINPMNPLSQMNMNHMNSLNPLNQMNTMMNNGLGSRSNSGMNNISIPGLNANSLNSVNMDGSMGLNDLSMTGINNIDVANMDPNNFFKIGADPHVSKLVPSTTTTEHGETSVQREVDEPSKVAPALEAEEQATEISKSHYQTKSTPNFEDQVKIAKQQHYNVAREKEINDMKAREEEKKKEADEMRRKLIEEDGKEAQRQIELKRREIEETQKRAVLEAMKLEEHMKSLELENKKKLKQQQKLKNQEQQQKLKIADESASTPERPAAMKKTKSDIAPWATVSQTIKPSKTLEEIQQEEKSKREIELKERRRLEENDRLLASRLALQETLPTVNVNGKTLVSLSALSSNASAKPKLPSNSTWAINAVSPQLPTKSLDEIQEEELEAARKQAEAAAVAKVQKSIAEAISNQQKTFANSIANENSSTDNAWTIVSKKLRPTIATVSSPSKENVTKGSTLNPSTLRSMSAPMHSTTAAKPIAASATSSYIAPTVPSVSISSFPPLVVDFLGWSRTQLTGLYSSVNKEDVLQIMMQLPVGTETQEIIADTIYSNSGTMDGRRFASEFMKKRGKIEDTIKKRGWAFDWFEALEGTKGMKVSKVTSIGNSGFESSADNDDWDGAFTVVSRKKGRKGN